jgi:SPP1 family predicted phage head-tail adaptor
VKWPGVDPGRLRHQIRILRQVVGSGPSGPKAAWVEFLWAWAAIEPSTAREINDSGQTVSEIAVPITLNWQAGIEAKMRVEAQGDTYIIEDIINPQGLNVTLTLMCRSLRNSL